MASVLRHNAEIAPQIRYFLTTQAYSPTEPVGTVDIEDAAIVFTAGYPGAIIEEGSVTASYVSFGSGALLKDLGRSVTLTDSTGKHVALYHQVQRVNGIASEGVGPAGSADGPYGCFFVKVWSADGEGVYVARVG